MTSWGLGALIAGIIWWILAYNMPISTVIDNKTVVNVFLIAARQSHLYIGWLLTLVGVIFTSLGIALTVYRKKRKA